MVNFILSTLLTLLPLALGWPLQLDKDPNVPFVEKFVGSLPIADFASDPLLLRSEVGDKVKFFDQVVKRNGSTYSLKKGPVKDVIVLSGWDDFLRRSNNELTEQMVYVVLRKKSDTLFHAFYVYVRDLFMNEPADGSVEIDGKSKKLEFDLWDKRGSESDHETRLGWSVCAKSFFVTCQGDVERLYSYPDNDDPDYPLEHSNSAGEAEEDQSSGNSTGGPSTVELYRGYFTDLFDEFTHSWFTGAAVLFITNSKLRILSSVELKGAHELEDTNSVVRRFSETRMKRQGYGQQQGGGKGQGGYGQQPSREDLKQCMKAMAANNAGGRGETPVLSSAAYGLQNGLNEMMGGQSQNIHEGSDNRGLRGDRDNPGAGLTQPVDTIAQFIGSFAGYPPNLDSKRSPGTALVNGVRNGGQIPYGLSEGVSDSISQAMGMGKLSNDRSHFDSIMDEAAVGFFAGIPALGLDLVDTIAKPLGLDPIINPLAQAVGMAYGAVGGVIIGPGKLAVDFGKLGLKALGLGGIVGMKGSSDKAGITACLNSGTAIAEAKHRYRAKQKMAAQRQGQGQGRSFGSKAVQFDELISKEDLSQVDLFTPIGWRGLYLHKSEPFIGFGSCIVDDNVTLAELINANTPETLADFYLLTLRTNCNEKQKKQLLDLISTVKILKKNDDSTLSIVPDSPLIKKTKLLPKELSQFSQAFEMEVYTRIYADEMRNPTDLYSLPDGLIIHHAVNTLRKFAFTAMSRAILVYPKHTMKLVRNLLITLKTAFVRLLQSFQVITICQKCLPQEQWTIGDDLVSVLSVMEFIMQSFEPAVPQIQATVPEIESAYNSWYLDNRKHIADKISNYVLPPLGRVNVPDYKDAKIVLVTEPPNKA